MREALHPGRCSVGNPHPPACITEEQLCRPVTLFTLHSKMTEAPAKLRDEASQTEATGETEGAEHEKTVGPASQPFGALAP